MPRRSKRKRSIKQVSQEVENPEISPQKVLKQEKKSQTVPNEETELTVSKQEYSCSVGNDGKSQSLCFDMLPDEMKFEIFKYCKIKSLKKLAQASRSFQVMVWSFVSHTRSWMEEIRYHREDEFGQTRWDLMKCADYGKLAYFLNYLMVGRPTEFIMQCIHMVSKKVNQHLDGNSYEKYAECFGMCMKVLLEELDDRKRKIAIAHILNHEVKNLHEVLQQETENGDRKVEIKVRTFFQKVTVKYYTQDEQALWHSLILGELTSMEKFKFLYIVYGPLHGVDVNWHLENSCAMVYNHALVTFYNLGAAFVNTCEKLPRSKMLLLLECLQDTPIGETHCLTAAFLHFCGKEMCLLYIKQLMKAMKLELVCSIIYGMIVVAYDFGAMNSTIDIIRAAVKESCYGTTLLYRLPSALLGLNQSSNKHQIELSDFILKLLAKILMESSHASP